MMWEVGVKREMRPPGFEPGSGAREAPILSRLDYGRMDVIYIFS